MGPCSFLFWPRLRLCRWPRGERSIKRGVVMVVLVWLVERHAVVLHPSMRFKLFIFFPNANAQVRGNPLPPEQPPESKRFCQAGRMNQPVAIRGVDNVRGHRSVLVCGTSSGFLAGLDEESLQCRLCGAEAAPSQTQSHKRQQHQGAQKEFLRRALQRAKSPEPFPHQLEKLGATRYPRAGSGVPSGWSEAIPVRHRIPREAPGKPRQCWANPPTTATCACQSRPIRSTARSRGSARRILDREHGQERGPVWRLGPQMKLSARLPEGNPALTSIARGRKSSQ